ncbi:MAG: hypothetical protein AAFQ82_06485 [Myxococcota bacterium]
MKIALPLLLILAWMPGTASAYCGEFTADDGDNLIIVGEGVDPNLPLTFTNDMAVCWLDRGGTWHYEHFPSCDRGGTDRLKIDAGAGNDAIVPMVRENYRLDFVCPVPRRTPLYPLMTYPGDTNNPDSFACREWNGCSQFNAGLEVHGGLGEDRIYGGAQNDVLYTHGECASGFYWGSFFFCSEYEADFSGDLVCAGNGSDYVYGDKTSDEDLYYETECLSGGDEARIAEKTDYCYGQDQQYDYSPPNSCEVRRTGYGPYDVSSSPTFGTLRDACCVSQQGPGCAAPWNDEWQLEQEICDADPYCCTTRWGSICVGAYTARSATSCPSGWGYSRHDCADACENRVTTTFGQSNLPPMRDLFEEYFERSNVSAWSSWGEWFVNHCSWNLDGPC